MQFGILHHLMIEGRALVGGLLLELTAYALELPPNQCPRWLATELSQRDLFRFTRFNEA